MLSGTMVEGATFPFGTSIKRVRMETNWAEIGNSTMKKNRKVWLSTAEDIADMKVQENIFFIKIWQSQQHSQRK